jgi:hypothetical protein
VLDTDKRVLTQAPAFEREDRPNTSDPAWRSRVYAHYGYPEPQPVRERTVVVNREYRPARREMSTLTAVLLVLLIAGVLGITYLVSTRGWEQTKTDVANSLQGVTYAMKETSGDAALTAKVKTALSLNKRIPAGNINVDSSDGVVTLRGDVADEPTRMLAGTIAQETPGVREVRNHLFAVSTGSK